MSGMRVSTRAARWAAVLALCVLAACARRAPVAPGALGLSRVRVSGGSRRLAAVSAQLQQVWTLLQANDLRAAPTRGAGRRARARRRRQRRRTVQGYVSLAGRQPDTALRAFDDVARAPPRLRARRSSDAATPCSSSKSDAEGLEALQAGAGRRRRRWSRCSAACEMLRLRVVDTAVDGARAARRAGRLDDARAGYTQAIQVVARQRVSLSRSRGRRAPAGTARRAIADLRRAVVAGAVGCGGTCRARQRACRRRRAARRPRRSIVRPTRSIRRSRARRAGARSTQALRDAAIARAGARDRVAPAGEPRRPGGAARRAVRGPAARGSRRRSSSSPTCATTGPAPGSLRSPAPASWSRTPTTRSSPRRRRCAPISRPRRGGCSRSPRRAGRPLRPYLEGAAADCRRLAHPSALYGRRQRRGLRGDAAARWRPVRRGPRPVRRRGGRGRRPPARAARRRVSRCGT